MELGMGNPAKPWGTSGRVRICHILPWYSFFFDIEKEYFQDFWRHLPDASATAHETTKTLPNSRPRCAHWWQWIKDSKCAWWAIMNCLLGQHLWRDISDWKFTPRCDWEPLDHLLKNLFWMMNFLMRDKNQWFSMNGGGLETAKIPLKLVTLLWIHVTPGRLPSQQQTNAPGLGPHLWDTWVMSFTSADFSMKLAWRGSQLLSDSSVLQHPRFRAGRNNST